MLTIHWEGHFGGCRETSRAGLERLKPDPHTLVQPQEATGAFGNRVG